MFAGPYPVSDLQQSGITPSSVVLTWSPPPQVKPGYSYLVDVSNYAGGPVVTSETTYNVSGLLSGGNYTCTVTTQTMDGTKALSPKTVHCFTRRFLYNLNNDVQFIPKLTFAIVQWRNTSTWGPPAGYLECPPPQRQSGLDWEPNSALATNLASILPGPIVDGGGGGWWSRLLTGGGGWSRLLTGGGGGGGAAVNKELRREVREISSRRLTGGPKNVQRPLGHCPVRPMASPALPISHVKGLSNGAPLLPGAPPPRGGCGGILYGRAIVSFAIVYADTITSEMENRIEMWSLRIFKHCILVSAEPNAVAEINATTLNTTAIFLSWPKPKEYQDTYKYRIEASNCTSRNVTVVNQEATMVELKPGTKCKFCILTSSAEDIEGEAYCTDQYTSRWRPSPFHSHYYL